MSAPKYIPTGHLEIAATANPNHLVERMGFDLSHPYLEQCWAPVIGPSAVCFLRRVPALWAEGEPASIHVDELARSIGLGSKTGRRSTFAGTLDRIVNARFAEWRIPGEALDVYLQVRPVPEQRLERVPEWCARAHGRLLASHLDGLASQGGPNKSAPTPRAPAVDLAARLDRLQQPSSKPVPVLGR
jgi:hypothetical protein